MKSLRLASFGIRGFAGESLDPKVLIDFASAFATFLEGGRVLLGRDTRASSPMLHASVASGLLSAGCEVLDFGICPTPILQFSVRGYGAAGAVSVSGGHNGMGWNAVTLLGADGAFLEPMGGEYVLDCFHAGDFLRRGWQEMGLLRNIDDFADSYFEALERQFNVEAVREKRFTVLIDPVGGAGCPYLRTFADRLGLSLIPINATPSGYLAREPEPRPRSASQMASIIQHVKGDVGFLHASDMGRTSIVTEQAEPASEEYTFPLIADHVLRNRRGAVITNCCTTRTLDDIAAMHRADVVKSPVGQAYVMAALSDEQGVIGGEGSGSVALPEFNRAFDGFLVMALILEAMAERDQPISALLNSLPRYHIVKRGIPCDSRQAYHAIELVRERLMRENAERLDLTDGLRIDGEDRWVHIRASKTQQLIRIISEAPTHAEAADKADEIRRMVDQAI